VTYDELIRRYPTNAPDLPWYELPDAELQTDLRFAAELSARSADPRRSAGAGRIARWIAQELWARAQRSRAAGVRVGLERGPSDQHAPRTGGSTPTSSTAARTA